MNTYGTILKRLITFSATKQATVAEVAGYDVSYVNKWCNQSKLPASRMAPDINRALACHFAKEINGHEDIKAFSKAFSLQPQSADLEKDIYLLLKDSYTASCSNTSDAALANDVHSTRILTSTNDIEFFFLYELAETLTNLNEPLDILCTFDVCTFKYAYNTEHLSEYTPAHDIHIRMGLDVEKLHAGTPNSLLSLYSFINTHPDIAFDFYDDKQMNKMNTIVVKNHLAILCTLDHRSHITTATIITDPDMVQNIYTRTLPAFQKMNLLINSINSGEFYRFGYRTDFYTQNNFQFFLTNGFEFLLPPECWASITEAGKDHPSGSQMARIISQLQITWEEIFEKGNIDFFIPPSVLNRYLEDGEIIFADVVYHMTATERKQHIKQVLEITRKNPNIRFFILDENRIQIEQNRPQLSLFNNQKMMFLKNTARYHNDFGPFFYTILSDRIIKATTKALDDFGQSDNCSYYDGVTLQEFYDKYHTLINRMIDLSESI